MLPFRKILSSVAGQMLLMGVMIFTILVIAVCAIFFVSQVSSFHATGSNLRTKSRAIAEEGINIAIQELSTNGSKWQNALNANFSGTDCNGSELTSPSGSHFYIKCSTGVAGNSNLQPYEIAVVAVSMGPGSGNGGEVPMRAMKAYVSRRTLGADLATGFHAPAALYLMAQPLLLGTGALDVEWGPIVLQDANNLTNSPWSVSGAMDSNQYPRKYSAGGIIGSVVTRASGGATTDDKEYWAYASFTPSPLINETQYIVNAESAQGITPPTSLQTGSAIAPTNCIGAGNTTCGYFQPNSGDTAVFAAAPYYSIAGNQTVYVNGWAQFDAMRVDSATFIVNGQLTIASAASGYQPNLHVPITAPLEYPYANTNWPCQNKWPDQQADGTPTYDCSASQVGNGDVQFRGFLYVKGNMVVNVPHWTLVGSLMVGDPTMAPGTNWALQIGSGDTLYAIYDDLIGQAILTNPIAGSTVIKVVPDQIRDIAL